MRYFDYISIDSKKYAQRQVDNQIAQTDILTSQIRAGKIVSEINRPVIRELIEGNYRIVYRILDEKNVTVLMVHHGAGDLAKRL